MDVTQILGIRKYEAPAPQDLNASGPYGYGIPKTDEHRYQSLDVDAMPAWGTFVDVTLKVDGQSLTAFVKLTEDKGAIAESGIGGRSFLYKPDSDNAYTRNDKRYNILTKLSAYCVANKVSLALRGESYGHGIQKGSHNPHAKLEPALALFSTWLMDERRYANKGHPLYIHTLGAALGLPLVQVLEQNVPLTPELIQRYDEGIEVLPNGQPFEGVVIQHGAGSFKVINKSYDARK